MNSFSRPQARQSPGESASPFFEFARRKCGGQIFLIVHQHQSAERTQDSSLNVLAYPHRVARSVQLFHVVALVRPLFLQTRIQLTPFLTFS